MTQKLFDIAERGAGVLRVAISGRAIVEADVKGMTLRFLPPEYVDLDRKRVLRPVRNQT